MLLSLSDLSNIVRMFNCCSIDTGILGTIQEHDTDGNWCRRGPMTPPSASRRSVRFSTQMSPVAAAGENSTTAGGDCSTLLHGTPSVSEMYTVDGGKGDAGSTLGAESVVCAASPDRWPVVDEDTYRRRLVPTPTHTPETLLARDDAASLVGNIDALSDRSGLTSMMVKMSRENSMRSDQAKHIMHEPPSTSPAPPPPSPEPKAGSAVTTQPPNSPKEPETLILAAVAYESDSEREFDLTVKPPSNLDDESRINTPLPRRLTPSVDGQAPTSAGGSFTAMEGAEESLDVRAGANSVEAGSRETSARTYGYQLTVNTPETAPMARDSEQVNHLEDQSSTAPHQRKISDPISENERNSPNGHNTDKKEHLNDETTVNPLDKEVSSADESGNNNASAGNYPSNADGNCLPDNTMATQQTAAVLPGYGANSMTEPSNLEENSSHLEEFDASEANFVAELQQEYDKLSTP